MLARDKLQPERYEYLDCADSKLYDEVIRSDDPKDRIIQRLLERISAACRASHAAETK